MTFLGIARKLQDKYIVSIYNIIKTMSKISKYLQISERLLVEYTYDTASTKYVKNVKSYVLKDLTGHLMFFMNPEDGNVADFYKSSFMYNAFPNATGDHYFYPGHSYLQYEKDSIIEDIAPKLQANGMIESIVAGPVYSEMPFDTVRVHIATGYTFADTLGFMLSIRVGQAAGGAVQSKNFTDILQNFVFHKGNMSESVEFNKRPFYMSSKFFDRYIEFQIPSAYFMAVHKYDLTETGSVYNDVFDTLAVDSGTLVIFDYTEITDDSFDDTASDGTYTDFYTLHSSIEGTDRVLYNQGRFYLSSPVSAEIALNTNSDYFNAKIYEDLENNCIKFYPIWGSVLDDKPVTRTIMNSIENGSVPMSIKGFTDDIDADLEEFSKIYGEDSRKWIIVNSINLEYHYTPFLMQNVEEDQTVVRTQKFTLTEDFQDDNDNITSIDDMYKFSYRPIVETMSGYRCRYINVSYTARLVNRLNGEEVIRYATLDIDNAESKYGKNNVRIDVSNIHTWKLYNKNEVTEAVVTSPSTGSSKTKYITKYVSSDNFVMNDGELTAAQGDFTISLYDTDHLYKVRIFTDAGMSEPYNMATTNISYLMRISDQKGTVTYLNPTYSSNMALANGELEFKITALQAKKILEGDRKFHIIAKSESGITTLFAGKFNSVFGEE